MTEAEAFKRLDETLVMMPTLRVLVVGRNIVDVIGEKALSTWCKKHGVTWRPS